ncbi:MAG TPA: formate dehydrogenase accessory sulfurtransferase FdhD [Pirellulales bacterium]|jgi:FdhD protein|nr:formate dehydrogenase accessory sulfurtransferase FdhD [Pirellulales bacterium]
MHWPTPGSENLAPCGEQAKTQRPFDELPVQKVFAGRLETRLDQLAVEEPLEIRLVYSSVGERREHSISITMRTPGHDPELAAGFLLSEGIVRGSRDIEAIRHSGPTSETARSHNVVRIELREDLAFDLKRLERHFYTTSSCGVCGKSSLEALEVFAAPLWSPDEFQIAAEAIHQLPDKLREAQAVFDRTGGLHAAALFNADCNLLEIREDVGRHNAVDKLLGSQLLAGKLPLSMCGILVSGRASFELVQKALVAGIPLLAAVGAPSSLAVELAKRYQMTLVGFVRGRRFNIYSGTQRIAINAEVIP